MTRFVPLGFPVHRLRDEMEKVFGGLLNDIPGFTEGRLATSGVYPPVNVWEDNEVVHVEAELAGMALEDLEVYARGSELTIAGERKPSLTNGANLHRQERPVGKFRRTIALPFDVEVDKVEAKLTDGVLTVSLPKAEAARTRKIEIRTS